MVKMYNNYLQPYVSIYNFFCIVVCINIIMNRQILTILKMFRHNFIQSKRLFAYFKLIFRLKLMKFTFSGPSFIIIYFLPKKIIRFKQYILFFFISGFFDILSTLTSFPQTVFRFHHACFNISPYRSIVIIAPKYYQ
jgi:hypothetical protein